MCVCVCALHPAGAGVINEHMTVGFSCRRAPPTQPRVVPAASLRFRSAAFRVLLLLFTLKYQFLCFIIYILVLYSPFRSFFLLFVFNLIRKTHEPKSLGIEATLLALQYSIDYTHIV